MGSARPRGKTPRATSPILDAARFLRLRWAPGGTHVTRRETTPPIFTVLGFLAYVVLLAIAILLLPVVSPKREQAIDEALDESVPASDPPAQTPLSGATVASA
jgi:hypothetical protein